MYNISLLVLIEFIILHGIIVVKSSYIFQFWKLLFPPSVILISFEN